MDVGRNCTAVDMQNALNLTASRADRHMDRAREIETDRIHA